MSRPESFEEFLRAELVNILKNYRATCEILVLVIKGFACRVSDAHMDIKHSKRIVSKLIMNVKYTQINFINLKSIVFIV